MKKLIALFLAAVLCLSLTACGKAPEASSESSAEPTESAYADVEACAGYAIEKLKTVLKNPASLQVNSLSAVATDDSYIYAIDYSAENSFGSSVGKSCGQCAWEKTRFARSIIASASSGRPFLYSSILNVPPWS